jgi:AcrR family transcriptional regulator
LQAIADAVGLDRSTMYYYFHSKATVIDALFKQFANSAAVSYATVPAAGQVSTRESPSAALTNLLSWLIEEQRLYRAFDKSEPSLPKSMARELKTIKRRGHDAIRELLKDGVRTGEFAIDDVTVATVALLGMCTGIAWWYSPAGPLNPPSNRSYIARLGVRAVLIDARVSPDRDPPADAERAAVFHGDGIGLLELSFDCVPLIEAVDRENAAASAIGIAEHRQLVHRLTFGVDRFASAFRVLTPVGNETPTQRIERHLASLMIAPDHQQFLAWRAVPARRVVVNAAVADAHAFNNRKTYRGAALDDPSAHDR